MWKKCENNVNRMFFKIVKIMWTSCFSATIANQFAFWFLVPSLYVWVCLPNNKISKMSCRIVPVPASRKKHTRRNEHKISLRDTPERGPHRQICIWGTYLHFFCKINKWPDHTPMLPMQNATKTHVKVEGWSKTKTWLHPLAQSIPWT